MLEPSRVHVDVGETLVSKHLIAISAITTPTHEPVQGVGLASADSPEQAIANVATWLVQSHVAHIFADGIIEQAGVLRVRAID